MDKKGLLDISRKATCDVDSYLNVFPRNKTAHDIIEMPYNEAQPFLKIIVLLVAQGKIRAAFLTETNEQKAARENLVQAFNQQSWNIINRLGFRLPDEDVAENNSEYFVSLKGDKALELQLPHTKRVQNKDVPSIIIDTVRQEAKILQDSFPERSSALASIFPGSANGGIFANELHIDSEFKVSIHQTVYGKRGMSYVINPNVDIRTLSNSEELGIISTGTLSIFGPKFIHGSSPEPQLAICTTIRHQEFKYG